MTKEAIIQKTVSALNKLPDEMAGEIADFADNSLKVYEEYRWQNELQKLMERSQAFQFLTDDDDLYTADDIKQKY